VTSGDAHLAVNYPLLLEKGLDGLRAKVAERRSRINPSALIMPVASSAFCSSVNMP
jgi:pyruvate-formate lyase